ncbi:MAG TPA: hypothetical protein PLI95_23675 [Polyangiaceae bacterium]|nr:hypothetical protein [Polyangiaceae bacterium]
METLTGQELLALVERVFRPGKEDRTLAILTDLPDAAVPDLPAWAERRAMAVAWAKELAKLEPQSGLRTVLVAYRNVRHNNADLPSNAWVFSGAALDTLVLPADADSLPAGDARPMREVLQDNRLLIAPTQFSATAPLKLTGKELGCRGATMPGFSSEMIPALRLDYGEINRRVAMLKEQLDRAEEATFSFEVDGAKRYELTLDLRHRTGHASGGLIPQPGTAGNLPSGEAYIVPYEGEREGDPSRSSGELPVQLGGDLVVYRIEGNRAVSVAGEPSATLEREAAMLRREPGYANLAELGLGVLGEFGVQPTGEILLDEKLGLHIAFGRSDHFGGVVGADRFSSPEAVVHIDRVYTRNLQPRVSVREMKLGYADGTTREILRDDAYVFSFA